MLIPVTFAGQAAGPHLLITGGVHGDEFEPIAAIRQLIQLFAHEDPIVARLRGRVSLLPVVNRAAFLRGHRCAEDGRDLARTCPGRSDGSITEQTAWALSRLIRGVDYYVDLHSGGTELAVFPLAGYMLHANPEILAVQRRMARAFNLPIVWGTSAALEGRSMSVARDAGVPAIYCEYLGSATCQPAGVEAYVTGCLNVMAELDLLTRARPANQVVHFIEDDAPGSGHMQVCNPAPITGYFEPSVKLGDTVRVGDPLGTVYSLEDSQSVVITSAQQGIVIVLRTFPRVIAGDSVGVIIDL